VSIYDKTVIFSETHENHLQMQRCNGNTTLQIKQRGSRA